MKTNCRQIVNPDYLGAYSLDDGNYSYSKKEGIIISCARRQNHLGNGQIYRKQTKEKIMKLFKRNKLS